MHLTVCVLIAYQFQASIIQSYALTIAAAIALFAISAAVSFVRQRDDFPTVGVIGAFAALVLIIGPTAAPVLLGLLTPTESICVVLLPTALLCRAGFDLVKQRRLSVILSDSVRGAADGVWILLAFLGATLIIYGVRLQGPLAAVSWLSSLPPWLMLAAYAAVTVLCCSFLGTTLGFIIAYGLFFPPFREAGIENGPFVVAAAIAMLASLARPEFGLKLTTRSTARAFSARQIAGFGAAVAFAIAVAIYMAPARY